jgi:hypothetical protein
MQEWRRLIIGVQHLENSFNSLPKVLFTAGVTAKFNELAAALNKHRW